MNSKFFKTSKKIANEFLQSIVFIDDKAFIDEKGNSHGFDALQITRAFANSEKVCAVYKPETSADIDNCAVLAKKADITVIDWKIPIKEEEVQGNSEEDAEEDDPRGPHTRKIIREILSDPLTGKGNLKLILIYTGETDLYTITDTIFEDLSTQGINVKKEDFKVFTDNIKILVIAKPSAEGNEGERKFKHNPELNKKIVTYEKLPDFILAEFTEMTSGLLSNFVLQSLTALRNNTFRLIKLYNKKLDPSFLSHRLLLPNQEHSKEQLIEALSHSIQALLNYNNVGRTVSIDKIESWIDQSGFSDSISVSGKQITLDNDFLKSLFSKGIEQSITEYWLNNKYGEVGKKVIPNFEKQIHEKGSTFFMDSNNSSTLDSEFSILTHHKSNLKQPSSTPKLSLGTLVRQDETEKYYLCIQAKCDSVVRLPGERKFLFLPLNISENKRFQFIVEDNGVFVKLNAAKEAYELRTIKFVSEGGNDLILAEQKEDGGFFFISSYKEKLTWICDLKDAHAQRIVNVYASQLSRVGLDESEWLRRRQKSN